MSTLARLGLFLVTLAVVFGGSWAAGAALDGDDNQPDPQPVSTSLPPAGEPDHGGHGTATPQAGATIGPGPSAPATTPVPAPASAVDDHAAHGGSAPDSAP